MSTPKVVYVVTEEHEYEGGRIVGVFASREGAEKSRDTHEHDPHNASYESYKVGEYEVEP